MDRGLSRRALLKASVAAAATVVAAPLRAQAPAAAAVTPALVEAAKKEGKLVWYAAMDLPVSQAVARGFEATYPGIPVRIERTGSERQFVRLAQEYAANIRVVDVINASDASHFIAWKRNGWLAPYLPEDVAKFFPAEHRDADGLFATARVYVSAVGYNTDLVKKEDAPKSFRDLLDPKWKGKIVKAHPGYSGTIMTATFQIARDLGWEFFEQLAKQNVLQVQSAVDPPKKLALGERHVMADGNDYNVIQLKEQGQPVEVVYPTEGAPLIVCPNAVHEGRSKSECGTIVPELPVLGRGPAASVRLRRPALHASAGQDQAGAPVLSSIKVMKDDPVAVEAQAEQIKARYVSYFKV